MPGTAHQLTTKKTREYVNTYPPQLTVMVPIRQRHKRVPIDGSFARPRADRGAHLVRERHILVSGALRHEVRARAAERVEFVDHDACEAVPQRVDVRDPAERANHRRAGDGVACIHPRSAVRGLSDSSEADTGVKSE